jgi:hypothetical protein
VQDGVTGADGLFALDPASGLAAIHPLRFWREITGVQTTMDTDYLNPDPNGRPLLAIVTIHRALTGTFNIAAGVITDTDTTLALVKKPLADDWTRRIALVRRPVPNDTGLTRWRIAGTSGVDVRTRDGITRIVSLRVQAADLDTTITNPLELHRMRRIVQLPAGTEVRLTATTLAANDVVLFRGHDLRRRFLNNGDGTHSFRFMSGQFPGPRHFGVDALSNGTLFDDAAPYDANTWAMVFAVMPVQMPCDR